MYVYILTHYRKRIYASVIWTSIISGNGLRPVGAKPLPEPVLPTVNWTTWNKFQWKLNKNTTILMQENQCEDAICKMATILSPLPHVEYPSVCNALKSQAMMHKRDLWGNFHCPVLQMKIWSWLIKWDLPPDWGCQEWRITLVYILVLMCPDGYYLFRRHDVVLT